MKNLNFKLAGILALSLLTSSTFAQDWRLGGNNPPVLNSSNNILGTNSSLPIRIVTNSTHRALFTTGNALSTITGDSGDGLRIVNPVNGTAGELDLFTSANSGQNETHIVWGAVGKYQVKIHD